MNASRALLLSYGGMVCVAIGVNLLPVYLTTFSETFGGLNEEELGRIPAVAFAGVVAGILVCGPLADRFGARLFAVGGLVLTAVSLGAVALADDYRTLLVASAVMGLGAGTLDMILSPIVSAICADRRTSALNRLHAFYCIGAVGTVLAASAGLGLGVPWRWMTAAFVAVPVLLTVGFVRVWLPRLVQEGRAPHGVRRLMARPRFHAGLVAIALAGGTEAGMAQWLPAYSERALGYGKATGGVALAAFSLAMVVGRVWASHLPRRVNPYGLVAGAGLACTALYLLSTLTSLAPLALTGCVLVGFGCSILWPTNLAITADHIPQGSATMFALLAGAGNVGCLATPWVEGIIAEQWGLRAAILAGTCCPLLLAFVAAGIWLLDAKRSKK